MSHSFSCTRRHLHVSKNAFQLHNRQVPVLHHKDELTDEWKQNITSTQSAHCIEKHVVTWYKGWGFFKNNGTAGVRDIEQTHVTCHLTAITEHTYTTTKDNKMMSSFLP